MGSEAFRRAPVAVAGGIRRAARGAVEDAQHFQERSRHRLPRSRRAAHEVAKVARRDVVQGGLERRNPLIVQLDRGDLRTCSDGRQTGKGGTQGANRGGAAPAPPASHYRLLLPTSSDALLPERPAVVLLRLRRNRSLPSRR